MTTPNATAHYPSLVDQTVLITGGATGIGASLVAAFVAQGCKVGFIDLDEVAGKRLVASLVEARHQPLFLRADLADVSALQAAVVKVQQAFGRISVLLNNAANDVRHSIDSTTSASWDAGVAINIKHQFFTAQAVYKDMQALGGGSIINFGSVSWMLKQGGMPAYTSSKAAVEGLTRGLARDFGVFNIRVNTLVPGWVMTEKQLTMWVDDQAREDIKRGQCINRPLLPEHIASMALFLAASDSAMCTGQHFIVDGGWV